jgi:hypothetical protein
MNIKDYKLWFVLINKKVCKGYFIRKCPKLELIQYYILFAKTEVPSQIFICKYLCINYTN